MEHPQTDLFDLLPVSQPKPLSPTVLRVAYRSMFGIRVILCHSEVRPEK